MTFIILKAWSIKFIHLNVQLNKANTTDTEAPFLDLHISIANAFLSSNIYGKRDDFDFDIVNFPFSSPCFLWCIHFATYSIRFARVCSHSADFNARNKC